MDKSKNDQPHPPKTQSEAAGGGSDGPGYRVATGFDADGDDGKPLRFAQQEARRLGHNFIGTEFLLLGLIADKRGIPGKALSAMDVTLENARDRIEARIGYGSGFLSVEIPFTPRAKRILEHSWSEATNLGHNYTASEHLLLGLIREAEGVGPAILEELGVELVLLREKVLSLINSGAE